MAGSFSTYIDRQQNGLQSHLLLENEAEDNSQHDTDEESNHHMVVVHSLLGASLVLLGWGYLPTVEPLELEP